MDFDAIIAGGSFAGLAVASQLEGKVLIVDRKEIGHGQTSACGTTLETVKAIGAESSVLQEHPALLLHTRRGTVSFDVRHRPFCTFDYEAFCKALFARCRAEFLRADIKAIGPGFVEISSAGRLTARQVIDCCGWRSLARGEKNSDGRKGISFGLESVQAGARGEGLHFYIDPELLPDGAAWFFPCGEFGRLGLAAYSGRTKIRGDLERFCQSRGWGVSNDLHGGNFPSRLRDPVASGVFQVGDSAGQCVPFSGEGIRPAVFFGLHCGRLLREVLGGRLGFDEAATRYRTLVARRQGFYRFFHLFQLWVCHLPNQLTHGLLAVLASPVFRKRIERYYLDSFPVPPIDG
jgi:flavin-dependent dehydrogenase